MPKDYQLRSGHHTLSGKTWASVQRATTDEVLNIWMETPKLPTLSLKGVEGKTISEDQDAQDPGEESQHETPLAGTDAAPKYTELGSDLSMKPFLEWLVLDDFGIKDNLESHQKVNGFLGTIYNSLSALCPVLGESTVPQPPLNTTLDSDATLIQPQQGDRPIPQVQAFINQVSGSGKPLIYISGKTVKDVDDLTYKLRLEASATDETIEQRLWKSAAKLLHYYISKDHDPNLTSIQLYWGFLYEIIVRSLLLPNLCLLRLLAEESSPDRCSL